VSLDRGERQKRDNADMAQIEATVHSQLRDFLRQKDTPDWIHHLTMARLVARCLHLGRSSLIQTGCHDRRYCLSYLIPALSIDIPAIIVAPDRVRERLLELEIPRLQSWLPTKKAIYAGDEYPKNADFLGLALISPRAWLTARLENREDLARGIPTIIDRADGIEEIARELLATTITTADWEKLRENAPQQLESIVESRTRLTKALFDRPSNPYKCYLIEPEEIAILDRLCYFLSSQQLLTPAFQRFWHQAQQKAMTTWATLDRDRGTFSLKTSPCEIASRLEPIWQQQPTVSIDNFLDAEAKATIYRQELGIGDVLTLKFSIERPNKLIELYLPDRLPLPNTPQFQGALHEQIYLLLSHTSQTPKPVVIIIGDVPLKARMGTAIAAEFGSRVKLETTDIPNNGILVTGWEFWREYQDIIPAPQLLIIATLPLPSLEHPLVNSRVAYYKSQRQDWFRFYLLPTALREMQRAILPLRENRGALAILDNRINYRSYGSQILNVLEPCARCNYIDRAWFDPRYRS
jgi:ATP-dependent DNA helicase DinG